MARNKRFGELLDEGISSVAKRQRKTMAAVEADLGENLGYSSHTVQHWRRGNLPPTPDIVASIARYCYENGRIDRDWARSFLNQARYPQPESVLDELFPIPAAGDESNLPKVFLSYRRGAQPDETLALQIARELSQQYNVFFDQAQEADSNWVERIQEALAASDSVIFLLSDNALHSEVVSTEVEMAQVLAANNGRTRLLPVRLAHHDPFPEPFASAFDALNFAYWAQDADFERLIQELHEALAGGELSYDPEHKFETMVEKMPGAYPLPRPSAVEPRLELPEGTMDPHSRFYIERDADQVAKETVGRQGITITIKGPRQVGKSSLLLRIMNAARAQGKKVLHVDFQLLESALVDSDTFFRLFCQVLSYRLGAEDRLEQYWQVPLPNPFRCSEYVGRYLLQQSDQPLLVAMDEVETVFGADFRSEFFGMLRTWHNNRAFDSTWKRLDLALVTSTEPYYFIDNLNQSPFNVGEVLELQPFTAEQVADLNSRHNSPMDNRELAKLMDLVNGHPYLVRRALYLVATGRFTSRELSSLATSNNGPFADHLRSLLLRLHQKPSLMQGLFEIVEHNYCRDEELFFRLRGAGLVVRNGSQVTPSCRLYTDFFREYFYG